MTQTTTTTKTTNVAEIFESVAQQAQAAQVQASMAVFTMQSELHQILVAQGWGFTISPCWWEIIDNGQAKTGRLVTVATGEIDASDPLGSMGNAISNALQAARTLAANADMGRVYWPAQ